MDKLEKQFLNTVVEHDMDFMSILRLYSLSYHDAPVATERNTVAYAISELFRRMFKLGVTPHKLREVILEGEKQDVETSNKQD